MRWNFWRRKCAHEFRLSDMKQTGILLPVKPSTNSFEAWTAYYRTVGQHPSHLKRISWPCRKCGEVFNAHCGLDILQHGKPV